MPTYAPRAAGALRLTVLGSVLNAWTSPVQAGDGSVTVVTDIANQAATTMLVYCTALVDLPCTLNWQTWVASLGSAFPRLAQEVLELLYQLFRVEVCVTQWARRLVNRRVIVLL